MSTYFPLITAHAGCMDMPMNSRESVLAGIEAGADIVEVDVNLTKDDVLVLFHDYQILGSSNQQIPLSELTFEELQRVAASPSVASSPFSKQILRLEEALEIAQHHHVMVNLDLKTPACISSMAEAVRERQMEDLVIISGCPKEYAAYVKQRCPEFQVLLNADTAPSASDSRQYEAYITQTCQEAVLASCCGINIDYRDCQQELLTRARLCCLPVLIYTVDQIPDMERFISSGVHSITTNQVQTLVSLKH